MIETTVLAGQEAGEFGPGVDAQEFAVTLSALLDGMAVQIAANRAGRSRCASLARS